MSYTPDARVSDTNAARYIARETAISAAINAAISLGFFLAVFGLGKDVAVWGIGNYAFDFLPQSFAVTFFASLVPSLLTRKAILSGEIASASGEVATVGSIAIRSIMLGLAIMVVATGLCAGLLLTSGLQALGLVPAFGLKILYGAVLGALVTRNRLTSMLS